MDKPSLNIVRAADIAAHSQEFSHPWNPHSQMHGTQLARSVGMKRTGVNFIRVPAGKESYAYHSHQHEEEWIYVLSGRAVALIDDTEYEVNAGDFIGYPAPSVPHLMRNPGPEELVYLSGGDNRDFEIIDFPKLGKRMVRNGKHIEEQEMENGEENGDIPRFLAKGDVPL
jgi:uncharacterized cupin superfamily protein